MNNIKLILAILAAILIVILIKSILFGFYMFLWVLKTLLVAVPIALILYLIFTKNKKD